MFAQVFFSLGRHLCVINSGRLHPYSVILEYCFVCNWKMFWLIFMPHYKGQNISIALLAKGYRIHQIISKMPWFGHFWPLFKDLMSARIKSFKMKWAINLKYSSFTLPLYPPLYLDPYAIKMSFFIAASKLEPLSLAILFRLVFFVCSSLQTLFLLPNKLVFALGNCQAMRVPYMLYTRVGSILTQTYKTPVIFAVGKHSSLFWCCISSVKINIVKHWCRWPSL